MRADAGVSDFGSPSSTGAGIAPSWWAGARAVVQRSSVPGGAVEAAAVAVVPLPHCTGTRPRLDGDGDGDTTTDDDDDDGVPRSAKTTGNSCH